MFIHSWNPEAAGWMAALYGPALRGSTHEELEVRQKTRSQARSIGRAARMVLAHEAERGAPYAVAIMLRSDLVIKERRGDSRYARLARLPRFISATAGSRSPRASLLCLATQSRCRSGAARSGPGRNGTGRA